MHKHVTEFIGTFLFVFCVALAGPHAGALAPLAIGAALAAVVALGGPVSGGHVNPAITLAAALRGRIGGREALGHVVAQIVGAAVASAVAGLATGRVFLLAPIASPELIASLVIAAVFSCFLALVFLGVTDDEAVGEGTVHGLVAGVTLMVALLVGGRIAGGAFNPAVALGPAIAAAPGASVAHVWPYVVGPLLGGALAALLHRAREPAATTGAWPVGPMPSQSGNGPLS